MKLTVCGAVLMAALLTVPCVLLRPALAQDLGAPATEPPGDKQAQIKAYSRARNILAFVQVAWTVASLGVLLISGLSPLLQKIAEGAMGSALPGRGLYFALCMSALALLQLPFSLYAGYNLEHKYGLSAQPLAGWLREEFLGFVVALVIVVPTLCFAYWLIGRSPRHWWLWFSAASLPVSVLLVVVAPVVIDPLFNKYTPLRDSDLKARILAMAHEQGIEARDVYEVDKSRQTRKLNAFVTGLLGTQRIVLWDTLLEAMPPREIESVMAHEMGHYVKRHVWHGVLVAVGVVTITALLVSRIAPLVVSRLPPHLSLRGIDDVAGFPLMALLVVVIGFFLAPAANAVSRHIEHQADVHCLQVTGDPDAAIASFRSLSEANLSDPEPPAFVEFWLYSHPSLAKRIAFAERYARERKTPPPDPNIRETHRP
ncbi:MAG: M48 family metallopeptidase [Armatimonadota bacterium]